MPISVNTKDTFAVAAFVRETFAALFPNVEFSRTERLFLDVTRLFTGGDPDYQANDLKYHDFEHTLQATVCLVGLLAARHRAGAEPALTAAQFELALAGVLLHDTGYQRLRSDTQGTSAKYTFVHVTRSCAYAATYLPTIGVTVKEIDIVIDAIRCTGPTSRITELHFSTPTERIIGAALASADYLAQMAAPDYPSELDYLYEEFRESYDFFHTPESERLFFSARELRARTPSFWHKVVLPKLENDFQGIYRYLSDPYPHGPNSYVGSIERNLAAIERSLLPQVR